MGSLCSKGSNHQGGHTVLGSSAGAPVGTTGSRPDNPRAAALQAAEARIQASKARGAPKQGALAAQAGKSSSRREPEPQQEERLVWD
ncbi:hypothetical protein B0H14DRAFT_2673391 [Mycena olivaceomarginata]|uniref:Uncharacterized protein n=1 Tax=Mycena albidolilacea TaxID=1033008 RepID=A0AAD7AGC8_9AGAR|nr:hypothetical protein DFH08DRAFT_851811 [Mycena albidolilacea]KAJ7900366.1 hypothetical protein B0H14DRAFT_2673391 [Mycena olivaceomarginata]